MKKIILFALIFLAACSTQQATITPEVTISLLPTLTATVTLSPTITQTPFPTLNQTQVAIEQSRTSTQSVFQTEVAQFPTLCPEDVPYFSDHDRNFSPDGLWLGDLCLSFEYGDMVLTFSNKKTQVIWNMFYHDYIPDTADFADGGMFVVHWSNDSRYAYFTSFLGGDGGECFLNRLDTGSGLFRLDLQTGYTKEILPLNDNFVWYGFSFSPTDKRLVYGIRALDLVILDITTGGSINVAHRKDFSQGGGYIWSPNGLEFIYSTVAYTPDHIDREGYTLRLVDSQTGVERILLESKTGCYMAKEWKDNEILTVEYDDENYNRALMEYDLNSNAIVDIPAPPAP